MKTSQIDRLIAEIKAEKRMVDVCIATLDAGGTLEAYSQTLDACLVRLTGADIPQAPKVRRGRKLKAQEPTL